MKLTEELLERKFPERDKNRLAARRATTRSDDRDRDSDSTSASTSSEVAVAAADAASSTGRSRNSLISSSKCASSEILRTRFWETSSQPMSHPAKFLGIEKSNESSFTLFASILCDNIWRSKNSLLHNGVDIQLMELAQHINKSFLSHQASWDSLQQKYSNGISWCPPPWAGINLILMLPLEMMAPSWL